MEENPAQGGVGAVAAESGDGPDGRAVPQQFKCLFQADVFDFVLCGVAERLLEPKVEESSGAAEPGRDVGRRKAVAGFAPDDVPDFILEYYQLTPEQLRRDTPERFSG